jgi:hypothetical protein
MASREFDPWAEERRGPRWGCWLAVALVVLVLGGGVAWYFFSRRDSALDAVTATEGRLTLAKDDGGKLKVVDRRQKPELWFRVTLDDAPLGKALPLTCEWVEPGGKIAHRNRFQTKEITHNPWQTHARHRLGADAPVGTWTVRLLLDGRELRALTFEVRDGGP